MLACITTSEQIRLRKFSPVDRASPLFEAVIGDEIVFDIGERNGRFDIAFHPGATKYTIDVDVFTAVVADAKERIAAALMND